MGSDNVPQLREAFSNAKEAGDACCGNLIDLFDAVAGPSTLDDQPGW